ncbi:MULTISPECIES: S24 family peptidase [Delftia]|jgi:phage repressor protein C with HTH and peptisase S24 domain|uniref:Helix-turn-helix transcriptional regulator n=1 Tax=Delftia deserti TaxID=1651218 RepID=A0ABW5ELK6_9BURK
MDTHTRLQQLLTIVCSRFTNGNRAAMARAIGKDASYINRLFYPQDKKGAKGIGQELMDATRVTFDLPRGFWEMTPNEALEALESPTPMAGDADQKPARDEILIRQYSTGGAMGGGLVLRDQPGVIKSWSVSREWAQKNLPYVSAYENLAIVTGFGDSMLGMFNPGDPLLVDKGVRECEFDGVYFFDVDGEGFIKRLQRIPGEGILVISENKRYRDWYIKPGMNFQILAKVLRAWESKTY